MSLQKRVTVLPENKFQEGCSWRLVKAGIYFVNFQVTNMRSVGTRAAQFLADSPSHLFLGSLAYACVALKRIWYRVVVF